MNRTALALILSTLTLGTSALAAPPSDSVRKADRAVLVAQARAKAARATEALAKLERRLEATRAKAKAAEAYAACVERQPEGADKEDIVNACDDYRAPRGE